MRLLVSAGACPPGSYSAKFVGVENVEHESYGPGLRWHFTVNRGPNTGAEVSRTTGIKLTPANSCGKIIAGLFGRQLLAGEEIDVSDLVGNDYLIVVAATENGVRVESVIVAPNIQ